MNIIELKADFGAKAEVCHAKHDALVAYIKTVLEANIDTKAVCVSRVTDNMAEIAVNGDHHHSFELYYHNTYGTKPRTLTMNFGCFGSFAADDINAVCYCEAVGHVAGILKFLEDKLLKCDEAKKLFNEYDNACRSFYEAKYALESAQSEERERLNDIKKAEITSKIAAGTKVIVHKKTAWRDEVIKTIEHVTAKNILFKEDYGRRTKKDDFMSNVLSDRWVIVAA